jgi:hypothetical protein
MRRIVPVFVGAVSCVALTSLSSVATVGARPRIPEPKPSVGVHAVIDWASRTWSGYADTAEAAYDDVTALRGARRESDAPLVFPLTAWRGGR